MKAFIEAQVHKLTTMPNVRMPRPSQCLMVTKMATPSLAAHAGVSAKDFLVSLDSVPAKDLSPDTYRLRSALRQWVFYSRPRHELITIEATGIEPGVKLQRTPDGIKETFNPKTNSPADLEVLWDARDYRGLEELSGKTITGYDRDHPALALLGAALYETGRKSEGLALVEEYVKHFSSHWTMNFTGIAYSYLALDLLGRGDQEAGLGMLYTAFEYHSCARLADLVEKYAGSRPPLETPLWLGRPFPDYRLFRLESAGPPIGLSETLAGLAEKQLFAVCLLASYRGNGPYNDFMHRYHNFATWFGDYLKGLHVITMEPGRPKDRAYYFKAEDAVRAAGLPLELLLEDGSLSASVGQRSSPFIVLVDRSGIVRYEGELDPVDMWTLAAAPHP